MACPDGKHKSEESEATPVSRKELALAAWILTASLCLASLPLVLGWLNRPSNAFFWAVPAQANYLDADQYLALTREAMDSGPFVADPYTTEPHVARLLIPHVLLQAGVCRVFGWHPLVAYHVCRLLFGAMLLAAGAWLGFLVLGDLRSRRLYLVLLGFSTGAGWILETAGVSIPNGDLLQPEGNTLHTLVNLPHLSLSAALLTFLAGAALKWQAVPPVQRSLWGLRIFAAAALLSWVHPFDFVTLGLMFAGYGAYLWRRDREFPTQVLSFGFITAIGALPAAAYLGWLVQAEPVYRALASDGLRVQALPYYAIAHGPLLLAGFPALLDPNRRRRLAPALGWALPVLIFLALPLPLGGKQCRLVGGIHVPLALIASAGLSSLAAGPQFWRRIVSTGAAAALCLGSIGVIRANAAPYLRRKFGFYQEPEIRLLFETLRKESLPGDIVLGGEYTGSWAPVEAPVRSYHGHWHMTLNEPHKRKERDRFYTQNLTPSERARWLRERGIRWLIHYPGEWRRQTISPASIPGVTPVFLSRPAVLYRFDPS